MKNRYFIIIVLLFIGNGYSQTTLSAGDITILEYNSKSSQDIKFLALKSMETGTTINFTDNGWKNDNTLRSTEGTDIWTALDNIACGDIITVPFTNIILNLKADGNGDGDQVLAYQGLSTAPTFICAINVHPAAVWQTSTDNNNDSVLPLGLTNGANAIAVSEQANVMYGSSTLIGSKSAILSAICTNTNWIGSNGNNLNFVNTFTSETTWTTSWTATPTSDYFKAIINGAYDTATDGDFNACELEVTAGNTLTVNASGIVTIENGIANSGAIVVEDDGAFVQKTKDGPNTGTVYTVERQTPTLAEEGDYTYWSSPLTSSTLLHAVDAQSYYSFDASDSPPNWKAETSSSSMVPGVGYAITGPNTGTYPLQHTASFTGSAFNNGDISVALSFSDDANATNDANLLGNPYPSAIDADAFLTANTNLGGTLYFWTHNTADSVGDNTQNDYVYWNGMGGLGSCTGCATPDGNIASGQGFFVQTIATGDITFTNAVRITTSGDNDLFYRTTVKSEEKEDDRIWLNVSSGTKFNQMLFGYHENATVGKDRLYDAERSLGGQGLLLNSILEDKSYAIQGKNIFTGYEELDLSIETDLTGEHKIEIDHLEGVFKNVPVTLLDKVLEVTHDLHAGAYTFNLNLSGEYKDRFVLVVGDIENSLSVQMYVKKNILNVASNIDVSHIRIYDILGRELYNSNKSGNKDAINLKKFKREKIIIVHVKLETGEILKKKVLVQD